MKAYLFPGQGAQFPGMANELYEKYTLAKEMFEQANEILGFPISDVMFNGTEEDLRQTKVTQPAIFLHSVILASVMGDNFMPDMVAGHSLGEFSALTAVGCISYKDGLLLVSARADAMQKACEAEPSTMAAILGMDDSEVEKICKDIDGVVVPANYNSPGQLVISGSVDAIKIACEMLKSAGALRAIQLQVGGAFHSSLMEPARIELEQAINNTSIKEPICPIYQNVCAGPETDPGRIKQNLVKQLTSPVLWTQTMKNMIADGATEFTEVGPGRVLQGLVKKVNRTLVAYSATI